ncbi:MAG: TonB-dependent receptor [Lysobacterales bacterium]
MSSKSHFDILRLLKVSLPLACMCFSSAAFAQQTDPATAAAEEAGILEEVVVTGIAYGAARAIQDQRNSNTLVTIVSEETLETIAEQSMGEALSRLPGIALIRDRGEAQAITIRGADARLNSVSMNGDRLLAPESTLEDVRGQRTADVSNIPSTLISEIQVYKAVPPNMDGDSIGGAVNVETKSATDLTEAVGDATVRYGYNDLSSGDRWSGEFTWGGRINEAGTWGFIGTVSYETDDRGISGLAAEWATIDEVLDLETGEDVDLGGDFNVIETYDVIWRGFTRERIGANGTFDWQPSENHLFKFGAWYAERNDDELRRRIQLRAGASGDFTTATTFDEFGRQVTGETDGGRVRRRVREGTVDRQNWNMFVEGNHELAAGWLFDWRASHQEAEIVINRTRARWEARAQDIGLRGDGVADFTFTDGNQDLVRYTQPAWVSDINVLEVGNRGDFQFWDNEESFDEADSFKLDFTKPYEVGNGTIDLQFGYKGVFRDRDLYPRLFTFDGNEDMTIYMREAMGSNPRTEWDPFGYDMGPWADAWLMQDIYDAQPDRFVSSGDTTGEEYHVNEDVNALYLMGTFNYGDWSTIVGARWEDTQADIRVFDGTSSSNDYNNFLPAIITRWNFTENQILRAAWTNGLGRPDFSDLAPFFSEEFEYEISDDTGQPVGTLDVEGGNPELQPFESQSFDLSWEWYFGDGGVVSAGLFYKEIDNFEYLEELRLTNVSISELPDYLQSIAYGAIDEAREGDPSIPADLDTLDRFNYRAPVNGDTSELTGYELNYQHQFVNLPGFWRNFGVFANYTGIDGDSTITEGVSRDFVIGQFDSVMNLQVFYEVEAWTARLAYNRNGVQYESLGLGVEDGEVTSNPNDDLGVDVEFTWDFSFQYRWNLENDDLLVMYFDVQNLTDEYSRNRFLGSETLYRFIELEQNGTTYNLGLKWSF